MIFPRAMLFVFLMAVIAAAADCGGNVVCKCGDTVVSDYSMATDLGPCPNDGLAVAGGASLDCVDHSISGKNSPSSIGILVANGANVAGCKVSGFSRGFYLSAVSGGTFAYNEAHGNTVGFDIDHSSGNSFRNNKAYGNMENGFYLFYSDANEFTSNEASGNSAGFFMAMCNGNTLSGNIAGRNKGDGFFVYYSTNNTFSNNNASGNEGDAFAVDNSAGNIFVDNDKTGLSSPLPWTLIALTLIVVLGLGFIIHRSRS